LFGERQGFLFVLFQQHPRDPPRSQVWVFGLVDASHSPALGYLEVVQRRNEATLLPLIDDHVCPATEVLSDQWRAYQRVSTFKHFKS